MIRAWLFLLWLLFTANGYSQKLTVVQINSEWNSKHNLDLRGIHGATVRFGYLEEQSMEMQKEIKAVPTIIVFKDGKPIKIWKADLSFKAQVTLKEIQDYIDSIK